MSHLELVQPKGIQPSSWTAITAALARLSRAIDASDPVQTVGCCKELVESVAKVVLEERGETSTRNAKYPALISQAHKALGRQPGEGLSDSVPLRDIAGGLKAIATQFAELRNSFGSGHGRSYEPEVVQEITAVSVDAAVLWARWALRRLEQQLYGALTPLITDLDRGIFYGAELANRLIAANLPDLNEPDQRRLGVAVAQRAVRDTFLVKEQGVEACAAGGLEQWPAGYRRGLLAGLLLDRAGVITINLWSIAQLPLIIGPLLDPGPDLASVLEHVAEAPLPADLVQDWGTRSVIHTAMQQAVARLPPEVVDDWNVLARRLDPGVY